MASPRRSEQQESPRGRPAPVSTSWRIAIGIAMLVMCGYVVASLAFQTKSVVLGSSVKTPLLLLPAEGRKTKALQASKQAVKSSAAQKATNNRKWPGDTIHSMHTTSGDSYMSIQSRIMYASYKMIQKMPGGEKHTGFTRILHRTIPDLLMDEIPTFWAFPYHRTDCDFWCDYPPIMRPHALKAFFDAARKNESMIQGAWVFMVEDDYVWMQPMKVPGSAWDPDVPAVQFLYDYIEPQNPRIANELKKLYKGPLSDIPASGASPVLMRQSEWEIMVPEFLEVCEAMEMDEGVKKGLDWVREMYAWDVAVARHKEIKIRSEPAKNSTTLAQPPFDDELGQAAMCHYTWGALFHNGLPRKGAKTEYKFEKREWLTIEQMIKIEKIPMPPEFKEGWYLQFDAPVTRKRYDMVVNMLTQINAAIDTLPDLTQKWQEFQPLRQKYKAERDAKIAKMKADAEAPQNRSAQESSKVGASPASRRLLQ